MTVPTSAGITGSFLFDPSAGDIVHNAYAKIQMRRSELTTTHYADAAMESNFLAIDVSNRNPNRWLITNQQLTLTQGVATYNLANNTIMVAIATLVPPNTGIPFERVMGPISASDYFSYPNKAVQAPPTSYFFSLTSPTPTVTLYPTPDGNGPYLMNLQTFRQVADVDLTNAYSVDCPYRFLDAYATGLAARLAQMYKPDQAVALDAQFEARFKRAAAVDQESVPLSISPGLSSYYQ